MKLVARIADITDVNEVIDFLKQCFDSPWSDNIIFSELLNVNSSYIMLFDDEELIGFGGYENIVGQAHIMTMGIRPDRREKGLGKILLSVISDYIRKSGITATTLEVRVSNTPAIRLYESMGFEKYGVRKRYYSDNHEDAIIMWRFDDEESN